MNFTSFNNWLFERKNETLEYACLMLGTDILNWKEKISIVKKEDIYIKDGDYGYEKEPHTTIIYGLHQDEINLDEIYNEIKKLKPVNVSIDTISFFECDEYDVVKFDVQSKDLDKLNKILGEFPHTSEFHSYEPHMTIAYVK